MVELLAVLKALENHELDPGPKFDWDPECVHGFAARQVAYASRNQVTWNEARTILDKLCE